jgi:hypothetical protein
MLSTVGRLNALVGGDSEFLVLVLPVLVDTLANGAAASAPVLGCAVWVLASMGTVAACNNTK